MPTREEIEKDQALWDEAVAIYEQGKSDFAALHKLIRRTLDKGGRRSELQTLMIDGTAVETTGFIFEPPPPGDSRVELQFRIQRDKSIGVPKSEVTIAFSVGEVRYQGIFFLVSYRYAFDHTAFMYRGVGAVTPIP